MSVYLLWFPEFLFRVHRCNKVIIDGLEETPFVQDETVPLAVGCTLALITLFILVGFSIHRAYHAAKVDYNSME
ncbi:lysosome-associated membrane glycoprotein 5 [Trichonephila clavipes]|nr:lysosome-associated membrane glycoprotein 5 [Trichonephila clavipes]